MLKKMTSESAKVAAVKTRATHRAGRSGTARAIKAPSTGSRIIQVRSLVNIIVVSSLPSECDHCDNNHRKHHDSTEETDHVGLYAPCLCVAQVTSGCRDQPSHPIDDTINDIRIESILDVRDAQHDIAHQQVIQIVKVELAQRQAMQEAQDRSTLHKIVNGCQIIACIQEP